MQLLDLTAPTPAANIAIDEALLEAAEAGEAPAETLRLWQPPQPMVVIGRASKINEEVDRPFCAEAKIPVLRRCSGGASIVAAPGCLMYAVVLSCEQRPALRMIDEAHRFVLERIASAMNLASNNFGKVEKQGTSDLVIGDRKVAGNSLRVKRNWLLYHGTILCDADLELISRCLAFAPRQPEYRRGRSHAQFVANSGRSIDALKQSLADVWNAEPVAHWPAQLIAQRTDELISSKYDRSDWNERL